MNQLRMATKKKNIYIYSQLRTDTLFFDAGIFLCLIYLVNQKIRFHLWIHLRSQAGRILIDNCSFFNLTN